MDLHSFIEPYIYASAPSIFLSIMTITLNIFVIKFYWKKELTVVSLLYTFIALLDILTAIGIIHLNVIFLLYDKELISEGTGNVNVIISSFFKEISYICSVFSNLVLAVSRTIMILKPFYQINSKRVQLACVLYSVPWIVLYGLNVHVFYSDYTKSIFSEGMQLGGGLAVKIDEIVGISVNVCKVLVLSLIDLIAFMIPVAIVTVTCIIQVISLHRSSQVPTGSNQRHVTITVILMSTLFVLCNSPPSAIFAIYCVSYLTKNGSLWLRILERVPSIKLLSATVLPILNASLNPVIIITRSRGMRRIFLDSIQRILRWVRRE